MITTVAESAQASAEQDRINRLAADGYTDAARDIARRVAEEAHAQYPQYIGHWDGYKLAKVTRRCPSRLRNAAAERGDYVLLSPEPADDFGTVTIYSVRNGIDTAVKADRVRSL